MLGELQWHKQVLVLLLLQKELRQVQTQPEQDFRFRGTNLGISSEDLNFGDQSPGPMSCLACCMFLHVIYPPFAQTNSSWGQEKLLPTTLHPTQDNGSILLNNGKVYNSLPYLNTMSEGKKR